MKTIELGLSCTPSYIKGDSVSKVTEITISHGGGMGGVSRTLYASAHSDVVKDNDFMSLTDYLGKKHTINKRFIVSMEEKQIVNVTANITDHVNYHDKTCSECIEDRYYLIDVDDTYIINKNRYIGEPRHTKLLKRESSKV